ARSCYTPLAPRTYSHAIRELAAAPRVDILTAGGFVDVGATRRATREVVWPVTHLAIYTMLPGHAARSRTGQRRASQVLQATCSSGGTLRSASLTGIDPVGSLGTRLTVGATATTRQRHAIDDIHPTASAFGTLWGDALCVDAGL